MDTFKCKVATDTWFPVYLGATAVTAPTVKYATEGEATTSSYTVTNGTDWKEITSTTGNYWLNFGAGEFSSAGRVWVQVDDGTHYSRFMIDVVAQLDSEDSTAINSILADTGTDGVVIATAGITAAKFAADAIAAAAIDDDVSDEIAAKILTTPANTLATDASGYVTAENTDDIIKGVLEESVSDHDGVSGSLAAAIRLIAQVLAGKLIADTSDNTIEIYDADGVTLLSTQTLSTVGTATTRNIS